MSCYGWAHVMLWVGMGEHRSLLMVMVMVWVWVQTRRKMLGSAKDPINCDETIEYTLWHD
jgi:hypothetical protein